MRQHPDPIAGAQPGRAAPARFPQGPVIAVTAEDDSFRAARRLGERLARSQVRPLILYDWDAPSVFDSPLPTWFSADGTRDEFGDRLDVMELEKAGRSAVANQVAEARARDVDAFGWLPSNHGLEALASYAVDQAAGAIVVPSELDDLARIESVVAARAGAGSGPQLVIAAEGRETDD